MSMYPQAQDLRYFLEIARTLNITRAAERLGVTQPTLSEALNRIEKCVGHQLVLRSRTGVTLTKAGDSLRHSGQELLSQWEKVKASLDQESRELIGHYTIGCHPSVGRYTLHRVLPTLLGENPKLNLSVRNDLSRKITEQVVSRRIDFGIVVNPVRHPDLVIRVLFHDEVAFWESGETKEGTVFCDTELVQVQSLLKKSKRLLTVDRIVHVPDLETIGGLVDSGAGLGILPGRVVGELKGLRLKRLAKPAGLPSCRDEICLVCRRDAMTPAFSLLWRAMHRSLS